MASHLKTDFNESDSEMELKTEKGDEGPTCDLCEQDGLDKAAFAFCVECQDYLCTDCSMQHCRPKPMRYHRLLIENEMPKKRVMISVPENCSYHTGEINKFYCEDHDMLCCQTCVVTVHKACDLASLSAVAKDYIISRKYEDYKNEMKTVEMLFRKENDIIEKGMESSRKSAEKALKELTNHRYEINKHFDKLEREIKDEAINIQTDVSRTLNKLSETCEASLVKIEEMNADLAILEDTEQDVQLFAAVKCNKKQISDILSELEKIQSESNVRLVKFCHSRISTSMTIRKDLLGYLKISVIEKEEGEKEPRGGDGSTENKEEKADEKAEKNEENVGLKKEKDVDKGGTNEENIGQKEEKDVNEREKTEEKEAPEEEMDVENGEKNEEKVAPEEEMDVEKGEKNEEKVAPEEENDVEKGEKNEEKEVLEEEKDVEKGDKNEEKVAPEEETNVEKGDKNEENVAPEKEYDVDKGEKNEDNVTLVALEEEKDVEKGEKSEEKVAPEEEKDIYLDDISTEYPCNNCEAGRTHFNCKNIKEVVLPKSLTMSETTVAILDYDENKISLHTRSDLNECANIIFSSGPWDLTKVGVNELAVTLPHEKKIIFLKVDVSIEEANEIATPGFCRCIAVVSDFLLVTFSEPAGLKLFSKSGEVLRDIPMIEDGETLFKAPSSVLVVDRNIFVTDPVMNTVTRMDTDGNIEEILRHENLIHPSAIAYNNEKIYVSLNKGEKWLTMTPNFENIESEKFIDDERFWGSVRMLNSETMVFICIVFGDDDDDDDDDDDEDDDGMDDDSTDDDCTNVAADDDDNDDDSDNDSTDDDSADDKGEDEDKNDNNEHDEEDQRNRDDVGKSSDVVDYEFPDISRRRRSKKKCPVS